MPFATIIATFNVQNFSINTSTDNEAVIVTCSFAINSYTDGCMIQFIQRNTDTVTSEYSIHKQPHNTVASTSISNIPNGYYTILVYDVVNGIQFTTTPAYTTSYTVLLMTMIQIESGK